MLFILFPIRKYVQIFVLFFIYTQQSAQPAFSQYIRLKPTQYIKRYNGLQVNHYIFYRITVFSEVLLIKPTTQNV